MPAFLPRTLATTMNDQRPALFLLCGLLCDREVWEHQATALSQHYRVEVVSFQDFDSLPAMAAHVLEQAPPRFTLAGHSMGGRVAFEVVRQAPQRVERLALLDTGCGPAAEHETEKRGVLVRRAQAEGIAAIAETWARPMLGPAADLALLERILAMVNRMSAEIYARHTRALLSRPDATPLLATIRCPTLLLCGQQDGWSPTAQHRDMAEAIPGAWLRLIEDCGHMSTMEQPEAVLAALEEWLGWCPPLPGKGGEAG